MSRIEEVQKMMPNSKRTWGAYDAKGGRAVNSAMTSAVKDLITLVEKEESGDTEIRFSLAKRTAIIEKAVIKFRRACDKHPHSGLEDSDVRDTVHGFLGMLLHNSGVRDNLAHWIVDTMPIDDV